jgi:hypothetical protein
LVPDPACANTRYPLDACNFASVLFDLVDDERVDRIHQAIPHTASGVTDDEDDSGADNQAHDGIDEGIPERRSGHRDEDHQRGQAVDARVHAVGNQRLGPDALPGADLEERHRPIA